MGDQVVTVQGHPEFAKEYSRALMDYRRQILGDAVHARGVDSLECDLDSKAVAAWLLRFAGFDSGIGDD